LEAVINVVQGKIRPSSGIRASRNSNYQTVFPTHATEVNLFSDLTFNRPVPTADQEHMLNTINFQRMQSAKLSVPEERRKRSVFGRNQQM
jgi:hypothetical protein